MKMKLAWHKTNLIHFKSHLDRKENDLLRLKETVEQLKSELRHRELQIKTAEQNGRDGFDGDKFLSKRGK